MASVTMIDTPPEIHSVRDYREAHHIIEQAPRKASIVEIELPFYMVDSSLLECKPRDGEVV
eukprot:10904933-Heterocapsa_arctica.AAC.1